jgi:hypothetical protein
MEEIWRKPFTKQKLLDYPSDDWGSRVFGRFGIAFTVENGDYDTGYPRAMSGTAPFAYSDDELTPFLEGSLLLDGEAAYWLSERGFAQYLGVTAKPSTNPCAVEILYAMPELDRDHQVISSMMGGGRYLLEPQSQQTKIMSSFASGSKADYVSVSPALTWYQNRLGGRIAVYGLSMHAPLDWVLYNSKRKMQLIETLTWLAGGISPTVVETDLDVFMLYGKDKKYENLNYIALFNLNPDPVKQVCLCSSATDITRIERLHRSGNWVPINFKTSEQGFICDADALTMEPFILRLIQ